ncbi:hypothetical protein TNCV_3585001 [Trichonephila clavipes]|nr:hypothetical protein TNCV_3585001 [Trichonephila clavipes]
MPPKRQKSDQGQEIQRAEGRLSLAVASSTIQLTVRFSSFPPQFEEEHPGVPVRHGNTLNIRRAESPLQSDEAHFWLNGYVNKQNCRIWSEANPQVYVETPLHPEKLTVWCALWAGGILLQKR